MSDLLPVTPGAGPEARALLSRLAAVSGRAVLIGQHNQPAHGSAWTGRMTALTGRAPAVWGMEFGFSGPGTKDAVDRRDANLALAVEQHRRGAVIVCTWHAVCPLDDEPVPFEGGILRDDVTDAQFEEILTPGRPLHERWCAQVDVAAGLLRRLAEADVPVLWRPYHEMNGAWFWWGGHPQRFTALWRALFERLVEVHELRNLLWVWNPNGPYGSAGPMAPFHPGDDVVDLLAVDSYGGHYEQETCHELLRLAGGRPVGLGEVGAFPTDEQWSAQPAWAWAMAWPDQVTAENTEERPRAVYASPRAVTLPAPGV